MSDDRHWCAIPRISIPDPAPPDPMEIVSKLILGADPDELFLNFNPGRPLTNAFCPTGQGGGIDPTCSPKGKSRAELVGGSGNDRKIERFDEESHIPEDLRQAGEAIRDNSAASAAVSSYTKDRTPDGTPVHLDINQKLRSAEALDSKEQALVNELDGITSKPFGAPITAYRGLGSSSQKFLDRATAALKSGEHVVDNGFGSTSLNPRVAGTAFSQFGVVCQVRVKRGAYLEPSTKYDGEHEVLLARGSRFKVIAIDQRVKIGGVKEYTVIRMEEV
jgi:hypothetical protein